MADEAAELVEPAKKKGSKAIIVAIVAAVVVFAAVGFSVWQGQPYYCNALCHTPMDSYVESYTANNPTKGIMVHKLDDITCLDCHEPELDRQFSNGLNWISGDYVYEEDTGKLVSRSESFATSEFCLQKGCHTTSTLDGLSKLTSSRAWNPHDFSVHGAIACGDCHKMHDQSVLVCSECHSQAVNDVPTNWSSIPYREVR